MSELKRVKKSFMLLKYANLKGVEKPRNLAGPIPYPDRKMLPRSYDHWKTQSPYEGIPDVPICTQDCEECGSAKHWIFFSYEEQEGYRVFVYRCFNDYFIEDTKECYECSGKAVVLREHRG